MAVRLSYHSLLYSLGGISAAKLAYSLISVPSNVWDDVYRWDFASLLIELFENSAWNEIVTSHNTTYFRRFAFLL
jgi:hypothetical protein